MKERPAEKLLAEENHSVLRLNEYRLNEIDPRKYPPASARPNQIFVVQKFDKSFNH
jgi:hypothetical protein